MPPLHPLAPRDQTLAVSTTAGEINVYCSGGALNAVLNFNLANAASTTILTQFSVNGAIASAQGFTNPPYNPSQGPGSQIMNGMWVFQPQFSTTGCTVNLGACNAKGPLPSVTIAFSATKNGAPVTIVNGLATNNGGTFSSAAPAPAPVPVVPAAAPVAPPPTTPAPQPQVPAAPQQQQQPDVQANQQQQVDGNLGALDSKVVSTVPPTTTTPAPQNDGNNAVSPSFPTQQQSNSTNPLFPSNNSQPAAAHNINPVAPVPVSQPPTNMSPVGASSKPPSIFSTGAVVGAVVGTICAVVVVVAIMRYIRGSNKSKQYNDDDDEPVPGFAKPGRSENHDDDDDDEPVPGFAKPGKSESFPRVWTMDTIKLQESDIGVTSPQLPDLPESKSRSPTPLLAPNAVIIPAPSRKISTSANPLPVPPSNSLPKVMVLPPAPLENLPEDPVPSPAADPTLENVAMTAIYDFEPRQDDELELRVGDLVFVQKSFLDGWGYGINSQLASTAGYFPMKALRVASSEDITNGNLKLPGRVSVMESVYSLDLGSEGGQRRDSLYSSAL